MNLKSKSNVATLYGVEDNNSPLVIESEATFSNNHKAANTWFAAISGLITPQAGIELAPHPKEMTHTYNHFNENDQRRKSCRKK